MAISKQQPMRQAEIALIDAVNAGGSGGGGASNFNVLASGTTEQIEISVGSSNVFQIEHELENLNYMVFYTVMCGTNIPQSSAFVEVSSQLVYADEMEIGIVVTNKNTIDNTSAMVSIDWFIVERND